MLLFRCPAVQVDLLLSTGCHRGGVGTQQTAPLQETPALLKVSKSEVVDVVVAEVK